MSERRNRCWKCGKVDPEVIRIHNPETLDMNARATLRCQCGETWEGLVPSPRTEALRKRGVIR